MPERSPIRHRSTLPSRFPTRRAFAWLAIGIIAFAVYGSLIPFEFKRVPLSVAWDRFTIVLRASGGIRLSRSNFLANILLFVPVGFGFAGALIPERAPRLAAAAAALVILPISLVVSTSVEFLQIFTPARIPALSDIEAQTIGTLVGIVGWAVSGPEIAGWLREAQDRHRGDRLPRALVGYAAVWMFVNLAPFDITVDLGQLAHRVRAGLINIVPFGGPPRPASRIAWDALITTISALPLGGLGLVGWTGEGRRRPAWQAFAIGATLVGAVEFAQVFVRFHAADVTDVLFGCCGVALGVWVGARVLSPTRPVFDGAATPALRGWAVAALVAWCVVLVAYHWMPYAFAVDVEMIKRKLARISLLPFAGYAAAPPLNAFNDLLVKLGLSMPLGAIASYLFASRRRRARETAGVLIGAALLFGAIEFGQFFVPTRSPDPSDVLIGVAGTTLGLLFGRWLQGNGP